MIFSKGEVLASPFLFLKNEEFYDKKMTLKKSPKNGKKKMGEKKYIGEGFIV